MYFTKDDFRKIEDWFEHRTVKDSDFPNTKEISDSDSITILHNDRNCLISVKSILEEFIKRRPNDFFNVTDAHKIPNLTLEKAISLVPVCQRKLGFVITFHTKDLGWSIYQFKGCSIKQWDSPECWGDIVEEAWNKHYLYPDDEDITIERTDDKNYLKFKDREPNQTYNSRGKVILRKNLVGNPDAPEDDEDFERNVLTQEMVKYENTIYIIQYDFDLDNKTIILPAGCTLHFQGGTLNNGIILLSRADIIGCTPTCEHDSTDIVSVFSNLGTAEFRQFRDGQMIYAKTKESSIIDSSEDTYLLSYYSDGDWHYIMNKAFYDKIVKDQETNKSAIETEIRERKAEDADLKNRVENINTDELNSLASRLSNVEKALPNKLEESNVTTMRDSVSSLESNVTTMSSKLNTTSSNLNSLIERVVSLEDAQGSFNREEVVALINNAVTEALKPYITASKANELYLSKVSDDTATGKITFDNQAIFNNNTTFKEYATFEKGAGK